MECRETGEFAHRETTQYTQKETFNNEVVTCVWLICKIECVLCIIYALSLSYYTYHENQSYYSNGRINMVCFSRNFTIRINTNA
jgi:hypothetical protein